MTADDNETLMKSINAIGTNAIITDMIIYTLLIWLCFMPVEHRIQRQLCDLILFLEQKATTSICLHFLDCAQIFVFHQTWYNIRLMRDDVICGIF